MGVREAYGQPPERVAKLYLTDADEVTRRAEAQERRLVYENNVENIVRRRLRDWFTNATVIERMRRFAFLGNSEGLFRRVVTIQKALRVGNALTDGIGTESQTKLVTATVSWSAGGQQKTAVLGTYLTKWR